MKFPALKYIQTHSSQSVARSKRYNWANESRWLRTISHDEPRIRFSIHCDALQWITIETRHSSLNLRTVNRPRVPPVSNPSSLIRFNPANCTEIDLDPLENIFIPVAILYIRRIDHFFPEREIYKVVNAVNIWQNIWRRLRFMKKEKRNYLLSSEIDRKVK